MDDSEGIEPFDILASKNVPPVIRWYARKCAEHNIASAQYGGWDIFTKPVKLEDPYTGGNKNILAFSDLYLCGNFPVDNYHHIVSESRIYVQTAISAESPIYESVELVAPYISVVTWSQVHPQALFANTTVSHGPLEMHTQLTAPNFAPEYYLLSALTFKQMNYDFPVDMHAFGGMKPNILPGERYTRERGGFNPYHAIALGILPTQEVERICQNTAFPHSMEIAFHECVSAIPSPQIHDYPDCISGLSNRDLRALVQNKDVYEICTDIRKPFMYFYPGIDLSEQPCMQQAVDSTTRKLEEYKKAGYLGCE